jgi:dTDP-4-dehydrorhamnose 3,5-epimerase
MKFIESSLRDACIITLEPKCDARGMFSRAFCQHEFHAHGLDVNIVQCNLSQSLARVTLRGMHYQLAPFAEVKLVRCIRGAIYDVIIDIRPTSPTYLKWFGTELTAANRHMLYVPEGFAHGYQTLSDDSEVFYMVSQGYAQDYERGIRWNDPACGLEWPIADPIISPRDASHPDFRPA